jgi:hypothetical protein
MSGGLGEAQDVAIGIFDVEITCAPGPFLERSRDGCATTGELRMQLPDSGDGQMRVEMLFRLPVGALRFELRRALQMDDCASPVADPGITE